jgi:hypothetical protein
LQLETAKARGRPMRCLGAALAGPKPKGPVQSRAAATLLANREPARGLARGGQQLKQNPTAEGWELSGELKTDGDALYVH